MELSIVIAACNSEAFVGPCLASLAAEHAPWKEVIVVDNASSDRTVDIIRAEYPGVTVLVNGRNEGHCRALNRGLAVSRGDYLMVLDVDAVVHPGALTALVQFLRGGRAVIAAPRMLNADGSIQETARRFPTIANGLFGRQTLLTRIFPDNRFARQYLRRDRAGDVRPFEVDWVSAACMAFPRTLVDRLGPWDEGFGVPDARVVHVEQNRPGRRRGARRVIQFHRGVFRFYRKHYTRGLFDPRALMAAAALSLRAALVIAGDLTAVGKHAP
jgi:GT2 family glycosyltransferase